MATAQEILIELQGMGSEKNRAIYRRHGVGEPLFGVSYADLKRLKKRIKMDQLLARELWKSGNHDARILATLIANPAQIDEPLLEEWVKELDNHLVAGALADLVAQSSCAHSCMARWIASEDEWVGTAGWKLLVQLALHDRTVADHYFTPYLELIEREIHGQKNRVREAMNDALIAIGIRSPELEENALAVASRVGKVHIDHGETNCKTRDATVYIEKTRAHQRRKATSTPPR